MYRLPFILTVSSCGVREKLKKKRQRCPTLPATSSAYATARYKRAIQRIQMTPLPDMPYTPTFHTILSSLWPCAALFIGRRLGLEAVVVQKVRKQHKMV